jgi:hypothetical protein
LSTSDCQLAAHTNGLAKYEANTVLADRCGRQAVTLLQTCFFSFEADLELCFPESGNSATMSVALCCSEQSLKDGRVEHRPYREANSFLASQEILGV